MRYTVSSICSRSNKLRESTVTFGKLIAKKNNCNSTKSFKRSPNMSDRVTLSTQACLIKITKG